uniref:Uncharacterized protein n=1 Tax=Anopheles atroparvus TaxID=41427 RepID=A0A182J0S6_ANOAO
MELNCKLRGKIKAHQEFMRSVYGGRAEAARFCELCCATFTLSDWPDFARNKDEQGAEGDGRKNHDGARGHLEGLASVYCEMLMAPFGEVLAALEEARQRAWSERSPHSSSGGGGGLIRGHRGNSCHGGLPNSHSQPIYVPGKYSSFC